MKPYQTENQTCRLSRSEILARQTLANIGTTPEEIRQIAASIPRIEPHPMLLKVMNSPNYKRAMLMRADLKKDRVIRTKDVLKRLKEYCFNKNISISKFIRDNQLSDAVRHALHGQQESLQNSVLDQIEQGMKT